MNFLMSICIYFKKNIYKDIFCCIGLLFVFTPFKLYAADCSLKASDQTVSFGNVTVSPDIAIGQTLTGDQTFSQVTFATCESSMTLSKKFTSSLYGTLGVAGTYNGRVTFSTNVPGVGVQFGGNMPVTSNKGYNSTFSKWISSGTSTQLFSMSDIGWGETFTLNFAPMLNLVKISDTIASGSLSGQVGYVKAEGNQNSATMNVNFGNTTIQAAGCTISGGKSLSIVLNDIMASDLPSLGSVGGESQAQDISLSCNAGTKVTMVFSGETDTYGTNVLKNNADATGVSVQLLDNSGTPITMGDTLTPTTNAGATVTIPLSSRYIRTAQTITAGDISASVTYTLNYQ